MSSIDNKLKEINYNMGLIYDKAYNEGKDSVENYLPYAQTATFPNLNLFGKADVVINMPFLEAVTNMFRPDFVFFGDAALNRTVEHITINGGEIMPSNMDMMFYFSDRWDSGNPLKHITLNFDTSKVKYANNVFGSLTQLKTVDGKPLDFSSVTTPTARVFYGSKNVEYARFVPNTIKCNFNASDSSAFTTETVDSIIDGLADLTGQTTKTLTLHSTVGAKLTDTQKVTITAKNWTLVY